MQTFGESAGSSGISIVLLGRILEDGCCGIAAAAKPVLGVV